MKDIKSYIEYKGEQIPMVFNLNVMEQIQEEYGSIRKWGEKVDGTDGEPSIKHLKRGLLLMFNEGIDIDNEDKEQKRTFLTDKEVGRIITEIGIEEAIRKMLDLQTQSTEVEESKNM